MLNMLKKIIQSLANGSGLHSNISIMDRSSGLPIWVSVLPQVEEALERTLVAMLYVDLEGFKDVEALFGREACQKILLNTGKALQEADIPFYGYRPQIATCCLGGDDFLIFIEAPPETPDFEHNYTALRKHLEALINQSNPEIAFKSKLKIHLGYSDLLPSAPVPIESSIYEAIKEAIFVAKSFSDAREHRQWHNMKQILRRELIKTVYQPIVSLKSGSVLGHEALSRGPEGSELASPAILFNLAERYKCLSALELLCHKTALKGAAQDLGDALLFINVSPSILASGDYQNVLSDLLSSNGINPKRVVLELTERDPIEDYAQFREALDSFRVAGYRIAIDDAGAGYSSLQAIAELQVEFVKIDCSLIRDIDQNPTKRALLETLVDFCAKVGSRIICEGIESVEELKVLIDLGCNYGQGYLLARPGALNAAINPMAARILKSYTKPYSNQHDTTARIGDFVIYLNSISPETSVLSIIEMFNRKKTITGLAVCQDDKPQGLIMRDRLFNTLGTRYGYEILTRKQARDIMDQEPLVLSSQTPLEASAKLIAERIDQGLNDSLIVTEHERYIGIVSISQILNSMAQIQIEQAKDANPLTGLPGNRLITRRISDALFLKHEFAVLYIDLDNFKAFNDYFGFEHGDRALLFLSNILREVVERLGIDHDLLGHIGGDDFIIITDLSRAERMAQEILRKFELRVKELYDPETLSQGFILTTDRRGKLVQVPIMTLSIAGVANYSSSPFPNHLSLAEAAGEVKQAAKAAPGSHYFFDRRKTWDELPHLSTGLF